jgi:hypothetical protein
MPVLGDTEVLLREIWFSGVVGSSALYLWRVNFIFSL